jgi:hypothetical protein
MTDAEILDVLKTSSNAIYHTSAANAMGRANDLHAVVGFLFFWPEPCLRVGCAMGAMGRVFKTATYWPGGGEWSTRK